MFGAVIECSTGNIWNNIRNQTIGVPRGTNTCYTATLNLGDDYFNSTVLRSVFIRTVVI